MAELEEPNSPADPAEPPRKFGLLKHATYSSVKVVPERFHGEFNLSPQPTNWRFPPSSPSPLASSPSHNLAPIPVEPVQVRASALHRVMLVSGVEQPCEPSVSEVDMPPAEPVLPLIHTLQIRLQIWWYWIPDEN